MSDDKKIILGDDDWKEKAQKEKEELSKKAKDEPAGEGKIPPADFLGLVNTLAFQAMLYMGQIRTPNIPDGESMVNMDLAKHNIDLLQVLEDKTKGNLTEEEEQTLSMTLHEIRMIYVQVNG